MMSITKLILPVNDAGILAPPFLPRDYRIFAEYGVFLLAPPARNLVPVSSYPLWLASIESQTAFAIEYITLRGKHRRALLPLNTLASKQSVAEALYAHNIAGSGLAKDFERIRIYLLKSAKLAASGGRR
jgi:hypothetical protein